MTGLTAPVPDGEHRSASDPVLGWRYWQFDASAGVLRSVSQRRFAWLPGRPLRAACVGGGHRAPAPGCRCGIYGARDLATLRDHGLCLAPDTLLVGRVALWGLVVPDEEGFRGEFAAPASLFVVPESLTAGLEAVVDALSAYRVPVETMPLRRAVGDVSGAMLANQALARSVGRLTPPA